MGNINRAIFYPSILLLGISALVSIIWQDAAIQQIRLLNSVILETLTPLYAYLVLAFVLAVCILFISPFSKNKLGGSAAQPLLRPLEWFAITLCTTIATGLLFWASAEPLFHVYSPPLSLQIEPRSEQSQIFALSSLLMHWTLSPYAIYTCMALLAAIALHNFHLPFRPSSIIVLVIRKPLPPVISVIADITCLFAMIGGMTASLGAGILTLGGGLYHYLGWIPGLTMYVVISIVIVFSFVFSSVTGIQKGIKKLSMINLYGFIIFLLLFSILPDWGQLISQSGKAIAQYLGSFIHRSINSGQNLDQVWFQQWTIFNWANWLAWAPVTAMFLGYIGRGYTIRQFIVVNLFLPAFFGMLWMLLIGGSAIQVDHISGGSLYQNLVKNGPESVQYSLIDQLPGADILGVFFLIISAISYITAADSSTDAISRLCFNQEINDNGQVALWIKVIWGFIIGILAVSLIGSTGIEGIKIISVLGGVPAVFFCLIAFFGLFRLKV